MSELDDIFQHNKGLRFLDKTVSDNERDNFKGWWLEQLYQYGTVIDYYTNSTTLDTMDPLYGEDPSQQFAIPKKLIFAITLNENAVVLQKFGLVSDDELTGFIPIESYVKSMSGEGEVAPEPKAGDVIELTEFGNTRPGGRGAKKFEITERLDQDVEQINPLLGHYVWLIKAKRFDYSYEQGITKEPGLEQPTDDTYHGGLSAVDDTQLEDDEYYFNDVDRTSRNIFDYSVYGDYDDIYGGYDDDN
jgi:hypothetical protein